MKRIVCLLVLLVMLLALQIGISVAQNSRIEEEKQSIGMTFSPPEHIINLTPNDIRNMRRNRKPLMFDITLENNLDRAIKFRSFVGNVEQRGDVFAMTSLKPSCNTHIVTKEEAVSAGTLEAIAEEFYNDKAMTLLIARQNKLRRGYFLPKTLAVPKVQKVYEVQKDDLLSLIAEKFYGNKTMAKFIAEMNGLAEPYQLYNGQVLFIVKIVKTQNGTVPETEEYTRKDGEDLNSITKSVYGDEQGAVIIAQANKLKVGYRLTKGQILFMPKIRPAMHIVGAEETLEMVSKKVYNDGTGAALLGILNGIRNFEALKAGLKLYVPEVEPFKYSCASWIEPVEREFTLSPQEARRVWFKSKTLSMNLRGTFSAIVGVEKVVSSEHKEGITSKMTVAPFCTVIITIDNDRRPLPKKAELHSFELQTKGNIQGMVFGLRNLGDIMVQVGKSEVSLLRADRSRVIKPRPLGAGKRLLLPGNRIELGTSYPPLKDGEYIARATVYYGGRRPTTMESTFQVGDVGVQGRARTAGFVVHSGEFADGMTELTFLSTKRKKRKWKVIEVENLEDATIHLKTRFVDIPGVSEENSATSSLRFRPASAQIRPFGTKEFQIILEDPNQTGGEGAKYSQLQIMGYIPKEKQGSNFNSVGILPSMKAIDIHKITPGSEVRAIKLSEFTPKFEDGFLSFSLFITNIGNVHLEPRLILQLIDDIGQVVVTREIRGLPTYLYPSEKKEIQFRTDLSKIDRVSSGEHEVRILAIAKEQVKVSAQVDISKEEMNDER